MNDAQIKAIKALKKALNNAGKVGLSGGVYDCSFYVFSDHMDRAIVIENMMRGEEEHGEMLSTPAIKLDGGAGV